jgi:hypothetical protein
MRSDPHGEQDGADAKPYHQIDPLPRDRAHWPWEGRQYRIYDLVAWATSRVTRPNSSASAVRIWSKPL